MFATLDAWAGSVVFWMLAFASVAVASVVVSKWLMLALTRAQERRTHGAWFALAGSEMYACATLGAIFIGVATFLLLPWILGSHCPDCDCTCDTVVTALREAPPLKKICAVLLLITAVAAPLSWCSLVWRNTARRIASLVETPSAPQQSPPPHQEAPGGKTIVILCDGTGNRADEIDATGRTALTNVAKFADALLDPVQSGWTQTKWYDPGVGTFSSRPAGWLRQLAALTSWIASALPGEITANLARIWNLFELAFGVGIIENVSQGYAEIVRQYEPGDCIAIFGFSRGAYTARVIAGVIARCGLLRSEHVRFAPDVVQLYRYRTSSMEDVSIRRELRYSRHEVPVHFLGLWDTVASLGVPMWGWWFRIGHFWSSNSSIDTSPASICLDVKHALSIDERRGQFFPTLFAEPDGVESAAVKVQTTSRGFEQTIEQVWFRGAHADVGGGYDRSDLSDIGLNWMVQHATSAGLRFDKDKLGSLVPNHLGETHDEMERSPGWKYLGSWPRWHPCPRPDSNVSHGYGYLDNSVYARSAHAAQRRAQRAAALSQRGNSVAAHQVPLSSEELHFLEVGETARIRIRADQAWNRTGLVLEQGGVYSLAAVPGGLWRDKECAPTGARGQDAARRRDLRSRLGWARRLGTARWMGLVGTVAHPRAWPLAEKSGGLLARYLLWEDPEELLRSLILMQDVEPGPMLIQVHSPSGVLHCFANDLWPFYGNNSGAIELDVIRVEPTSASTALPRAIIDADGIVRQG